MNSQAENELSTILAGYKVRVLDSQEREANIKAARAEFVETFRALKKDRIGPILEEFVARLKDGGHQATVLDQQEASDGNGRFTPASISLRVLPARVADSALAPSASARIEITFAANAQTIKVLVSSTNNGSGTTGRRGDYELSEMTVEFVEANVLTTIREGFALAV
jgi:hypothetical protein